MSDKAVGWVETQLLNRAYAKELGHDPTYNREIGCRLSVGEINSTSRPGDNVEWNIDEQE